MQLGQQAAQLPNSLCTYALAVMPLSKIQSAVLAHPIVGAVAREGRPAIALADN
jgi:hypothetical protein